jgi:hypothetical protein
LRVVSRGSEFGMFSARRFNCSSKIDTLDPNGLLSLWSGEVQLPDQDGDICSLTRVMADSVDS